MSTSAWVGDPEHLAADAGMTPREFAEETGVETSRDTEHPADRIESVAVWQTPSD